VRSDYIGPATFARVKPPRIPSDGDRPQKDSGSLRLGKLRPRADSLFL
jgi:hypothetical protein